MLKDVDVLVYDLQEVGGRTWTYVSTMALSMQAAASKGIPFVVLDRPNPIGGDIVEGALLDPAFASFIGMYPIPARHGMTVGELATLFNSQQGIGADLTVVPAQGWPRGLWFDQTGLPWVNPSPNLRSLAAVAATMNAMGLPGIAFQAVTVPVAETAAKFPGRTIPAIRLAITDRLAYRPVGTALLLIDTIRQQHPDDFAWGPSIDALTGSDRVRTAINADRLAPLLAEWDRAAAQFRAGRAGYLLYS